MTTPKYVWKCGNCGETVSNPDTLATEEFHCLQCRNPLVAILPPQPPTESGEVFDPSKVEWHIVAKSQFKTIQSLRRRCEDQIHQLTAAEKEVKAILDLWPDAIRVCEGGGPENIYASLAVSVASLRRRCGELIHLLQTIGNVCGFPSVENVEQLTDAINKKVLRLEQELSTLRQSYLEVTRINEAQVNRLAKLEKSHGGLVGALIEIRDNPNCIPPELAEKALTNAQSLPTDNI